MFFLFRKASQVLQACEFEAFMRDKQFQLELVCIGNDSGPVVFVEKDLAVKIHSLYYSDHIIDTGSIGDLKNGFTVVSEVTS
jgi:hypothetical protein